MSQSEFPPSEDGRAAAGPPAHLALQGIVKRFGPVEALAGVDVDVREGELLTILGPSGSGKTTMLKVVAGFEFPDEGSVVLAGTDITAASPAQRGIGMVFQNYALFPHMRVAENIAFPLEMRNVARREIGERVERALELVGLGGYEKRFPRQLSGGQQQRVALARAVVFEPRLLLLDEPFGALDRKLREQMQLEVKHLQRQLNLTALFVTHDQEEALVLSDRIAVMSNGRIEQLGRPEDIYARPVNRFVADFIGESNLFEGTIVSREGPSTRVRLGSGIEMPARVEHRFREGDTVGVLVRPEIPRALGEGEEADVVVSGTVAEVVYVGNTLKYQLQGADGIDLLVRWPYTADRRILEAGAPLRVGWSADAVHLVEWA